MQWWLCIVAIATVAGCSSPEAAAFDAERPWRRPGDVIDSILPMEEHERRFRAELTEVAALSGGEQSIEALVQRFLAAVSTGDSVALRGMVITRAEFAWLVFPDHRYRRPPYELDPATLWMQIQHGSAKGRARLLERHGRTPLALRSLQCERDTLQLHGGRSTMWGRCQVEYQAGDSVHARRLFSGIIERDGEFKFLSFGNDF